MVLVVRHGLSAVPFLVMGIAYTVAQFPAYVTIFVASAVTQIRPMKVT